MSKSAETQYAIFGTPNTPTDDRTLFNFALGLESTFLSSAEITIDTLTTRFSDPTTPFTQTWGIDPADIAAYQPASALNHFDELYTDTADSITDFLTDNAYPQDGSMVSLLFATEYELGLTGLDDQTATDNFTFNLTNIDLSTTHAFNLATYAYDTSWEGLNTEDMLISVGERYSDLDAALAELQLLYPDVSEASLWQVVNGYYTIYASGIGRTVAVNGTAITDDEIDESALTQQLDLASITDLFVYLIEAVNLGIDGGGLVIDSPTDLQNYLRTEVDYSTVIWFLSLVGLDDTFTPEQTLTYGKRLTTLVFMASYLYYTGYVARTGTYGLLWLQAASTASKFTKFTTAFANWAGTVLAVVGLGVQLYFVWSAYLSFSSPYAYERQDALAFAIASTILLVAFTALAFTGVGAILVAAIYLADLIVWFLSWLAGDEFHFISELTAAIVDVFFDVDAYTQIYDLDFSGMDSSISSGSALVAGATLTLDDKFTGQILRVDGGSGQLDRSDIYAYFEAKAISPGVTVDTNWKNQNCSKIYSNYILYCTNKLEASFLFTHAQRNAEVEILYKVVAKTRYEKCTTFVCEDKTDTAKLPDELDDGWDETAIVIDVLPNNLDDLWTWHELTNHDPDGDDLETTTENLIGSDPYLWDTDGDGLSDGYEYNLAADLGTDPLDADSDDDGLTDGEEFYLGTIIDDPDSDDDGRTDGEEVFHFETGTGWTGGGYEIDIDGTTLFVFADPLEANADGDVFPDGSEFGNGSSPMAINDGPTLLFSAEPTQTSPSGATLVTVGDGTPFNATLTITNTAPTALDSTVTFCPTDALTTVQSTETGDSTPAMTASGDCFAWNFSAEPLPVFGTFQAQLTATGTNLATTNGTITVDLPYTLEGTAATVTQTAPIALDNTIPTVQIIDPLEGELLGGDYYVVGGTSADSNTWVDHVEITVPGGTFTATGTAPWAYTWELPDDGVVNVTAIAYDSVGNASASDTITVAVDSLDPIITTTLADGATIASSETYSTTFTFSGTVSDNYSGITRIQMRFNNQEWRTIWEDDSYPVFANWSGEWSIPIIDTAQGEHTMYLRAYDLAGNVSYLERTVFIDIIPPTNEMTNRTYTAENPPHVPANQPLTLYGVANDAGNNPLPTDPAELTGNLHSITDATVWLQPDTISDNDGGISVSWIGDFNGDRLADLAVGFPAMEGGAGKVIIVKGDVGDWPNPKYRRSGTAFRPSTKLHW